MYLYLIMNSGHQTPLKNPFTKMHCFQQKGEITNCVDVRCQETGKKKKSTVTIIIILSSPEYFNLKEIDVVYFFKKNFFPIESVSTHNYLLDLSLAVFRAFY